MTFFGLAVTSWGLAISCTTTHWLLATIFGILIGVSALHTLYVFANLVNGEFAYDVITTRWKLLLQSQQARDYLPTQFGHDFAGEVAASIGAFI
jgi:hypothetical protein